MTRIDLLCRPVSPELQAMFDLEPRLEHWAEAMVVYGALRDDRLAVNGTDNPGTPSMEEADLEAWLYDPGTGVAS